MTRAESIARDVFIFISLAGIALFCALAVAVGFIAKAAFTLCDQFINWTKTAQDTVKGWGR